MTEDDPPELLERKSKLIIDRWNSKVRQQFDLVYYGKFDYADLEDLSVHEFNTLYGLLSDTKKEEYEDIKKKSNELQSKSRK